ncbi:hypothetical protein [Spongorhabdus nitratireducens]
MFILSILLGIVGTFFAYIEIWHPKTLKLIESLISNHYEKISGFKNSLIDDIEDIRERGDVIFKDFKKGPHYRTPEQSIESKYWIKKSFLYILLYQFISYSSGRQNGLLFF